MYGLLSDMIIKRNEEKYELLVCIIINPQFVLLTPCILVYTSERRCKNFIPNLIPKEFETTVL